MAKSKLNTLTSAEQKQVLSSLKQQTAAWLLGLNCRTLRDRTDFHRNSDGTYSAKELFAGIESTSTVPHLDTEDLERVLLISNQFYLGHVAGPDAVAIHDALVELEEKHGAGFFISFMREMLSYWKDLVENDRKEYSPPTREEIEKRVEAELADEEEQWNRNSMKVAVVCDYCHKLRRGRRWVKAKPPAGYAISNDLCPDCMSR